MKRASFMVAAYGVLILAIIPLIVAHIVDGARRVLIDLYTIHKEIQRMV